MIPKNIYLIMLLFFFTSCSAHLEVTSEERKMDYIFEQELVKELNKIRRVKGLPVIQRQSTIEHRGDRNPFDAQMKGVY